MWISRIILDHIILDSIWERWFLLPRCFLFFSFFLFFFLSLLFLLFYFSMWIRGWLPCSGFVTTRACVPCPCYFMLWLFELVHNMSLVNLGCLFLWKLLYGLLFLVDGKFQSSICYSDSLELVLGGCFSGNLLFYFKFYLYQFKYFALFSCLSFLRNN